MGEINGSSEFGEGSRGTSSSRLAWPSFAYVLTQPYTLVSPSCAKQDREVPSASFRTSSTWTLLPARTSPVGSLSNSASARILSLVRTVLSTLLAVLASSLADGAFDAVDFGKMELLVASAWNFRLLGERGRESTDGDSVPYDEDRLELLLRRALD